MNRNCVKSYMNVNIYMLTINYFHCDFRAKKFLGDVETKARLPLRQCNCCGNRQTHDIFRCF